MRSVTRCSETLNLIALSLWAGALIGAGGAAAILFPTLKQLAPTLPDFAAFPDDHWKIAGGLVGVRLFVLADVVQLGAACATILALIVTRLAGGTQASRAATGLRLVFMAFAWLLASYQIMVLGPRMQTNLNAFYAAAKAGQVDVARVNRDAFDADHPTASRVLGGTLLAVMGALAASAWGLSARKEP